MTVIYGLKTCDTCRKAAKAFDNAGVSYEFRDVRSSPLDKATQARFLDAFGHELINRRSTTWRGLSDGEREDDALALLDRHPALMKRPVIEGAATVTLGWGEAQSVAHLGK
ncbi:MAG: ArsC/Spx/MgsR family protein [Paracoccaceae bacterium]|nr:ArsC/Spx/MgsR family protein [Paracoccaceae bacterium]